MAQQQFGIESEARERLAEFVETIVEMHDCGYEIPDDLANVFFAARPDGPTGGRWQLPESLLIGLRPEHRDYLLRALSR